MGEGQDGNSDDQGNPKSLLEVFNHVAVVGAASFMPVLMSGTAMFDMLTRMLIGGFGVYVLMMEMIVVHIPDLRKFLQFI
jgi:hypothetical protein